MYLYDGIQDGYNDNERYMNQIEEWKIPQKFLSLLLFAWMIAKQVQSSHPLTQNPCHAKNSNTRSARAAMPSTNKNHAYPHHHPTPSSMLKNAVKHPNARKAQLRRNHKISIKLPIWTLFSAKYCRAKVGGNKHKSMRVDPAPTLRRARFSTVPTPPSR